ncbi:hypothetical protein Aros01_04119 [Streptosporangium roseum]
MEIAVLTTQPEVFVAHANARLTMHGRTLLIRHVRLDGRPVAHVAKELGISRQCAHRWVRRYDEDGRPGPQERSSRPHRVANRTPAAVEEHVVTCRRALRCGPAPTAAQPPSPPRSPPSEPGRNSSSRTAPGKTARSNASTGPCKQSGPTGRPTPATPNAPRHCNHGWTTTTPNGVTAHSTVFHRSADCHQPHDRVQPAARRPAVQTIYPAGRTGSKGKGRPLVRVTVREVRRGGRGR